MDNPNPQPALPSVPLPEPIVVTTEPKPGIQSSEFWITVMAAAFSMALTFWGAVNSKDVTQAVGVIGFIASTASYNISRGIAKKAA